MLFPQAQSMIERLAAVDLRHPRFEAHVVEGALRRHLRALGHSPLPIRWIDSASLAFEEGYRVAEKEAMPWWHRQIKAARHRATMAVLKTERSMELYGAFLEARDKVFRARPTVETAAPESAARGIRAAVRRRLVAAGKARTWDSAAAMGWSAALPDHNRLRTMVVEARDGIAYVNAAAAVDDALAGPLAAIWLPIVEACEAGLFLCSIPKAGDIICVPRPRLHVVDHELHRADGPAVEWTSGERQWFWRGAEMPQWWIEVLQRSAPIAMRDGHSGARGRGDETG